MTLAEYDPDNPKGWVLRWEHILPSDRLSVAWWFGPDSGWGTTWGALHLDRERFPHTLEVAVFPTKAKALTAARTQFGRLRSSYSAQRLADALKEAP